MIARIKAGPNDITLYPAAGEQLLNAFETKAGFLLPPDFKRFYSFSNGFLSDEDLFRIIPLEELMDNWHSENRSFGQFYFAEYLIYSDLWGVDVGTNNQPCYSIFYPDLEERKLFMTDSFAEFLNRFLTSGVYGQNGLYDWSNSNLEALKP